MTASQPKHSENINHPTLLKPYFPAFLKHIIGGKIRPARNKSINIIQSSIEFVPSIFLYCITIPNSFYLPHNFPHTSTKSSDSYTYSQHTGLFLFSSTV